MTPVLLRWPAAPLLRLLLLLACLALSGCAPMLVQALKQDPRDPQQRYQRVPAAELAGVATVIRAGRPVPLHLPYQLQPGDVIQTGADAAAVVRLPEGHEIVLDANTRVRLGSFFVEFGRIFARVRGFFEAESDNVVAGVEGTEFSFEVARDRGVSVVVLGGTVLCRSKSRSWAAFRLRRGELFRSPWPNVLRPEVRPATPAELEDLRQWVRRVDAGTPPVAPPPRATGYCCVDGRVFEASRERCPGGFHGDRAAAQAQCRPPLEPGYCCTDGQISQTTRERCTGRFYTDAREARAGCRSAPPIRLPPLRTTPYERTPAPPAEPVLR